MKTLISVIALAGVTSLGGCIIVDADEDDVFLSDRPDRGAGTVFGADIVDDAVHFRVTSNGCTDKSFFDIDVTRRSSSSFSVELDRVRRDNCEADMPDGVQVTYTFQELGIPSGASVRVRNAVRKS